MPKCNANAVVTVIQHLSVNGVMTNLEVGPKYSLP